MAHINICPVPPLGSVARDDTGAAVDQAFAGLHAVVVDSDFDCGGEASTHGGGDFDASEGPSSKEGKSGGKECGELHLVIVDL